MAPGTANGPFPLSRALFNIPDSVIQSMSVHRLFVWDGNRFEVAVLQYIPETTKLEKQQVIEEQLTKIADDLTASLQECTAHLSK